MDTPHISLKKLQERLKLTLDKSRVEAISKRHSKGFLSARENIENLCDQGTFQEYGQLAVAAQRLRISYEELQIRTPADGVVVGTASINSKLFPIDPNKCRVAIAINDYTVLAGTQGYFHHKKLDRILKVAEKERLPFIMFTEGGGGRPGDTDLKLTHACSLDLDTFYYWAKLSGIVPRIAVNNGYCFAGNAALFGSADIRIATESSWIGLAGPAMIEGGGLGIYKSEQIGPIEVQSKNGVIDLVVKNEKEGGTLARKILSYFQGTTSDWKAPTNTINLRKALPDDRRYGYEVRPIIDAIVDADSFVELKQGFGGAVITGFCRMEGKPMGLVASDSRVMGGALDAPASDKTASFFRLCETYQIPLIVLADTPGFMVGPQSEANAAVTRCSDLFNAGAKLTVPLIAIMLRKGYGLGAMALVGGSFTRPGYIASWPSGEFGGMGLEGAVKLGYKKELDAQPDEASREALFSSLLEELYSHGKATEVAAHVELDAVIDPLDTRETLMKAIRSI